MAFPNTARWTVVIYDKYIDQFLRDFAKRNHNNPLIGSIRKWIGSESSQFDTASFLDFQKLKFYSTITVDLGHETQGMQKKLDENYVQLPNDNLRQSMLNLSSLNF